METPLWEMALPLSIQTAMRTLLSLFEPSGTKETGGKKFIKRGLVGLALTHGKISYHSRLAIIDAKNGDILFLGDYTSWDPPGTNLLEKSFKKLPVKSATT